MTTRNRRQLRALWMLPLAFSRFELAAHAQNASNPNSVNPMAAQTREWRLDGTVVGLDTKRGVLRLQPDVLLMRAEGDAVAMGEARENETRLIATDANTQMWTPDGKLQPLQFAALRQAAQIIAIGPVQGDSDGTVLRARLLMLSDGLPTDYRPRLPQPNKSQRVETPAMHLQVPPQISAPTARPQVLAPSIGALKTPPQVVAQPQTPPQISTPATRPQPQIPPQISAPVTPPQVLAAPIPPQTPSIDEPHATIAMRESSPPLPVAPPIINRAPQNDETRLATIAPDSSVEISTPNSPAESSARAILSGGDWSRRVPPPTLSAPTNSISETNSPQVLAAPMEPPRNPVAENRASQPPNTERAVPKPLGAPRLSANTDSEDLPALATSFPRVATENTSTELAAQLRATTPSAAPRDTRQPTLSLSTDALTGRGALTLAPNFDRSAPIAGDGRAVLRLDDAQTLLQNQQSATVARDNYAQLRSVQNAVRWSTFSNGASDEKLVALTFDDGPHPTGTPAILAQLGLFNAPATFFVVGRNVEKYPDLLREAAASGHDIANHSWHHFQGVPLSAAQWHEEIAGNNRIIESVLGVAPRWFRAPGCHYSSEALAVLSDLQMVRTDTTNNSGDWEQPDPQKIVNRVLGRLAPGQVLLFHDSAPQTAQALPILLRELKARGYRCVTLSELAQRAAQVPNFVPEFHPVGQGIVLPANVVATR